MVKMLSSLNSNPHSSSSPLEDESPSSEFQILDAPPSNINGTYSSHLNDLHFSISNAVFDVPAEEIQNQLRDLLKENVELKETLHQNNVAMGEQFQKLLKWREEMTTVQDYHRKKFEETRKLIQQLQIENAELKNKVQKLDSTQRVNETLEAEMIVLKRQSTEQEQAKEKMINETERLSVVELQLKKECLMVQSQHDSLKAKNGRLLAERQDLLALNNELSSKLAACQSISPVESILHTLESSKADITHNQHFVMVSQGGQSNSDLRNDKKPITELLLQLHHEQNKVSAMMKDFVEEQKKTSALTKEVEDLKKQLMIQNSPRQQQPNVEMLNELLESEKTLNAATNYLERYKERCTSLEHWLGENQGKMDVFGIKDDTQQAQQLRQEMVSLRQTLIEQQSLNQEDRKNLLESRQKFELLLKDYQELLKSWESYYQELNNRESQSEAYYEIQIKKLNEQIDNLTAKLVCNEETLQNKIDEIARLRSQTHFSCQELEKVPILQAQVEVYQSDFRAEREHNDQLISEKSRLMAEKQELVTRIRQLETEMRRFNAREPFVSQVPRQQAVYVGGYNRYEVDGARNGEGGLRQTTPVNKAMTRTMSAESSGSAANTLSRRENTRSKSEQPLSPALDDNVYFCPKCNYGFTDFKALENHVNECLDNDDPFLS